jgi:hypothetical protein
MNRRNPRARQAGFTVIELAISSAILAGALFTALSISQAASRASNRSVLAATRDAALTRRLDCVRRLATRVGSSTLMAVPTADSSQGNPSPVLEPMVDGVVYDNLCFREPVGFFEGQATYEPPLGEEPRRIELVRDERTGAGSLVLVDGDRSLDLAGDVSAVTFEKNGGELTITLTGSDGPDGGGERSSRQIHVALRAR